MHAWGGSSARFVHGYWTRHEEEKVMCDMCLQSPCNPRCPNAPEPPAIHKCMHCDEDIVEGEGYYDVDGEPWCEHCMNKCYTFAEVEE